MASLKDKAAIVGIGYTPQGKIPGRTSLSFHLEAGANAIVDAGLKPKDVDGLLIQPAMGDPSVTAPLVAQHLGLRPHFLAMHDVWGASACCQIQHAVWALTQGVANYVLCTYGEDARSGVSQYNTNLNGGAEWGYFSAAASYAMAARRAMYEFRTGPETWKEIAVAQRKWANLNPRAVMYQKTLSYEDYYNSKLYVEPFRLFDICLISDSGRAFIVTTAERAKDLRKPPVYIMGMGQDHPVNNPPQAVHLTGHTGAEKSGKDALRMAGINLEDLDAVELYDCFTYTVEVELADYGFYRMGESQDFLKAARLQPGGDFPLNTSGGLLSEAYQMGFTPLTEARSAVAGRSRREAVREEDRFQNTGDYSGRQ